MMSVRLVHFMHDKRKELMIIYPGHLAPTAFTVAELKEGGKAHDQWAAIAKDLVERTVKKITIERSVRP